MHIQMGPTTLFRYENFPIFKILSSLETGVNCKQSQYKVITVSWWSTFLDTVYCISLILCNKYEKYKNRRIGHSTQVTAAVEHSPKSTIYLAQRCPCIVYTVLMGGMHIKSASGPGILFQFNAHQIYTFMTDVRTYM